MANRGDKETILGAYETIEKVIIAGRSHMHGGTGCRPNIVTAMLGVIAGIAGQAKDLQWPDPEAEKAASAKRDRTLQKVIKKCSRKTPIRAA